MNHLSVKHWTIKGQIYQQSTQVIKNWGRRGRDRMVVGFTTTCAISAYHF